MPDASLPYGIVAIPARDEAGRIGGCLAALAVQRDPEGAPLPAGAFGVLVFANNCTDGTAAEVERWAALSPQPISVVSEALPQARSTAGWARKRAMDFAADSLAAAGQGDGVILTTDADSCVSPTWISATMRAIGRGADAVAGYIDAHPAEWIGLGPAFTRRGRLEDHYLRLMAETMARADPRPHDPWPNHRVASGASLAVTLRAYRAIGGLPPLPVGEDAALAAALDDAGFAVRHAMDVVVSTSCRFDGRAPGGAADTMRLRHGAPEAPCDADLEPAVTALRRFAARGRLRRVHEGRTLLTQAFARRLRLSPSAMTALRAEMASGPFGSCWRLIAAESPVLRPGRPLAPSDLPGEITRAERILRLMRREGAAWLGDQRLAAKATGAVQAWPAAPVPSAPILE